MRIMRVEHTIQVSLSARDVIELVAGKLGIDPAAIPDGMVAVLRDGSTPREQINEDDDLQVGNTDDPLEPHKHALGVQFTLRRQEDE